MRTNRPQFIIVHHTQRNNDWPSFIRWRHKHLRGWNDIGYHYVIGNTRPFTKDGKIYIGRPENVEGAHALGYNFKSIGICLVGNFNRTFPSENQMRTLLDITKQIMSRYQIPIGNVFGHGELPKGKESCPGKNIDMNEVRWAIEQNLEFIFWDRRRLCVEQ